jgi:RNA polymerase sigma-70 factor (ECF subfamily)
MLVAEAAGWSNANRGPGVPEALGALLEGCRAQEAGAWHRFFDDHSGQVYRWSVLLGLAPADAEEAAQEVFATAARRIATCRSEAAINSWLFQITRRVVANARRAAWWRRLFRNAQDADAGDADLAFEHNHAPDVELEFSVRRCLRRLSASNVEILVLMDLEGRTREEVAQMLDLPEGTVASRLRRARDAFREQWSAAAAEPVAGGMADAQES